MRRHEFRHLVVAACLPMVGILAGCVGFGLDWLRLIPPAVANFPAAVIIDSGILYSTRQDEPLLLDLYRPAGRSNEVLPLVAVIHGGAWDSGSREQLANYAYDLAAHGYAAATIDYRLTDEDTAFPDPLADIFAAVNYLRRRSAEFGLDPDRIALFGMSAGAHLALMAGLPNDASEFDPGLRLWSFPSIKAIVNICGPTDFTADPAGVPEHLVQTLEQFLGQPLSEAGDLLIAASPIRYVRATGPAVLTIHGDADDTVPVSQAYALDAAMAAVGQPHELQVIPGMGHLEPGIWLSPEAQQIRQRVLTFLAGRL